MWEWGNDRGGTGKNVVHQQENGGKMRRVFPYSHCFSSHFARGSDGKLALPTVAFLQMWYPNIQSKMGGKQGICKKRVHKSLQEGGNGERATRVGLPLGLWARADLPLASAKPATTRWVWALLSCTGCSRFLLSTACECGEYY